MKIGTPLDKPLVPSGTGKAAPKDPLGSRGTAVDGSMTSAGASATENTKVSLSSAALAASLPAAAQFQKPEDAVKYRQSAMTLMSAHVGRIAAMAGGKVPFDAAAAKANADVVATLSRLPFSAFVPGSDVGQTRAKPEIWVEQDKFRAAAGALQDAVGKLQVATQAGNLDQIKAAVGEVGKSCKSCHDQYRKE